MKTKKIPDVSKTTAKNGMVILSEKMESVRSVALGIHVGVGSGRESEKEWGLSHFIEHMTFRGTKKRTSLEIAKELDIVGGKINAFTGKEATVYFAIVQDEYIHTAIEVLTDIFLNSVYDQKDIEIEKSVALEEIKMYDDAPDEFIHDLFAETILGGHSMGRSTLGSTETLKVMNRDEILKYRKKYYTPDNVIIAAAGNISHKTFLKELEPFTLNFAGKKPKAKPSLPEIKGEIKVLPKKTEQVHLCLGSKGVSHLDKSRYAVLVLDNILAGSMSSRLFQEVREKRGLVYSIYSYNLPFKDFGIYGIYAGTSKEHVEQVVDMTLKELKSLKKEGIDKDELKRAKNYLKGGLVLGLESTSSRMSWIANSEFHHHKPLTIDEVLKKIDRISHEDIIELCEKIFKDQYLTLIAVGDYEKGQFPIKEIKL